MKRLKIYILFVPMLILGACTGNFDELAKNPNSAEEVIPSMIFTGLAWDVAAPNYGTTIFYPALVSRQVVWTENIHSYQYYYFDRSGLGGFGNMRNVQKMMQEAERTGEMVYKGLGHFFNAWFLYDMTIALGDIPYSDAMKGETEGVYSPKYDSQEDVFVGILDELEMANEILGETDGVLIGDIVYNGSLSQWRMAVNTFALKVLTSLSKRAGDSKIDVAQKFNQIFSNPSQYPVFKSNADNMQLEFRDKGGERYPFWNHTHRQYPHLDKSFTDMMKQFRDKRLFYYAAPTGKALDEGLTADDFNAYEGGDGTDPFENLVALEAAKAMSRIHPRYYEDFDNEPYVALGYAELQFNLAEAAQRGWTNGNAREFYDEGIAASVRFIREHGRAYDGITMDDAWIESYRTDPRVIYNSATGVEQIITQKYIASFLNSGWNTYFENRRTGFPTFNVNPATSLNTGHTDVIPVRWRYPQKELDYNTENVEEAIKRQFGEDNVNANMWLIK
ncbi:Starch-binding associating with outer membrane [Saccharicrinis carchari]|uniref:Starch-binding associating with outer membrane n=1 Tax=Saccharicrinis carchari TaxID=1168039 RepID=A0A521BYX5_SACCC|nr:SusD/RagB family nutrient-binding outer membrane lipoprotein [Saccharicrinis carchari]SMO52408.1 Starch-binding associating with outer membrane [Saccharicrinis carchari]